MMLSKNKIKNIHSLEFKKFRNESNSFVAEGNKLVADMLSSFECESLITTSSWMAQQSDLPKCEVILIEKEELKKASFLKTPQDVLAVFKQPSWDIEEVDPDHQLVLALDGIQDPGNLGTIVRLADWFGIRHVVCSMDTADIFSPKTVQATMGALARVKVHYSDIETYLSDQATRSIPLYGTFLDGEDIYDKELDNDRGILVMGNEGNGIRPSVGKLINERLYIPNYPTGQCTSESLNVATATAVICAEFRRRQRKS